jgi:hypothetical protein
VAPRIRYRQRLLRAVDLFLEQTPAASARALRIIQKCNTSLKSYSLDELQWGGVISELTDTVFTNDTQYLATLRHQLATGEWEMERLYLHYDVREALSSQELRWYEALRALSTFLGDFPHPNVAVALQQYQRMVANVRQAQAAVPADPEGDETLLHLILAETTAVLTQIHLDLSLRVYHFLAPSGILQSKLVRADDAPPVPPNAAESVAWARKALDALAGEAQLFVTWQMRGRGVRLVIH